jgi:hypothetical protein
MPFKQLVTGLRLRAHPPLDRLAPFGYLSIGHGSGALMGDGRARLSTSPMRSVVRAGPGIGLVSISFPAEQPTWHRDPSSLQKRRSDDEDRRDGMCATKY